MNTTALSELTASAAGRTKVARRAGPSVDPESPVPATVVVMGPPCVVHARVGSASIQRCKSWRKKGGDREWSLNDGQIANPNVVRVALGTGYHRVEGNRRASRNGPVSDLPPEIPTNVTIRNFCIAGWPRFGRRGRISPPPRPFDHSHSQSPPRHG